MRNAYANRVNYVVDLANKTGLLVREHANQEGLGRLTKTVTFDVETLETLRSEPGPAEAKAFNLVRGLRQEVARQAEMGAVLRPLQERAEGILKDLEDRKTAGLAALDRLAALAEEKNAATAALRDSGLSPRAFGVHWALKDEEPLKAESVSTVELAREAETLLHRFPNAAASADERRRLRAALYRPLLRLGPKARSRVVESILTVLLDTDTDATP